MRRSSCERRWERERERARETPSPVPSRFACGDNDQRATLGREGDSARGHHPTERSCTAVTPARTRSLYSPLRGVSSHSSRQGNTRTSSTEHRTHPLSPPSPVPHPPRALIHIPDPVKQRTRQKEAHLAAQRSATPFLPSPGPTHKVQQLVTKRHRRTNLPRERRMEPEHTEQDERQTGEDDERGADLEGEALEAEGGEGDAL